MLNEQNSVLDQYKYCIFRRKYEPNPMRDILKLSEELIV